MAASVFRGWLVGTSVLLAACTGSSSAGSIDAAEYSCAAPPADVAACASDGDCSTVASGCYCGAQPVTGVARIHAPTAQACETTRASMCGLGCANQPGYSAQDGKHVDSAAMILVHCDKPSNAPGTCTTYVP